jgi:two-component system chemotaxis response regulator CheY
MLCDDSRTILTLLEKKLTDAGHEVVGKANDGEEGVKLFASTKPDLALLDITMPNKDGRECLRGILSLNPGAKTIMVSALQEESVVQECLKTGARAFITKSKIYANDEDFKKNVLSVIENVLKAA